MTLILEYLLGALLQLLGALGASGLVYRLFIRRLDLPERWKPLCAFAMAGAGESLLLGALSLVACTPVWFLVSLFWVKVALVLPLFAGPCRISSPLRELMRRPLLGFWTVALLLNASLPTSCYDAFTSHFAVARLFLEAGGHPARFDYQYLFALPLGGHMWLLPGLAAGFEGAANFATPLFSVALVYLFEVAMGRKGAIWAFLILLSIPQFIRLSLDPMMDAPCLFYATFGLLLLRTDRFRYARATWMIAGLSWALLAGIKQTLLPFWVLWSCLFLWAVREAKIPWRKAVGLFLGVAVMALFWYARNLIYTANPVYPFFFSRDAAPLIPSGSLPPVNSLSVGSLWDYLFVVFLDRRWMLSIGPWFLAFLPCLLRTGRQSRGLRVAKVLLFLGFLLTMYFRPFKN
ncbi:MAG: hypothetical protein HQL31_10790, partial [Planctomycetes bacterium]|nr:hypothetical protein [Planctomycetota bacterium]